MLVVSVHSAVLRTKRINIDKALRNVLPAQDPFYCCLSLTYADLPGGGLKPQTMTESRWGRNLGSHLLSSILESSLWNLGRVIWPLLEHTEKKTRSISGHLKERTEKTCSISRHLKGLPCIELSLFLSALTFALSVGIRDNKVINIPLNNGGQLMVYS